MPHVEAITLMWKPLLAGTVLLIAVTPLAYRQGLLPADALDRARDLLPKSVVTDLFAESPARSNAGGQVPLGKATTTPVAVEAVTVRAARTSQDIRALGSLQSDESVQITPEIAGRITEIPLVEGGPVKAGDVLVHLDDSLAQAEVTDAEARMEFAKSNLGRANTLAKTGNVTERARDEASTNAETARAAVELAKVRLAKHSVLAPFSGIAGIRRVSPGAYVSAGQPIVNLEKIDALKIDFKVPELFLSDVRTGQKVDVMVDAIPGRTFPAEIYAIDPHLDVNGRALSIRARLANPNLELRPGLFARIEIKGLAQRSVVLAPESAIVPMGNQKVVYRVENGRAVETAVALGGRKDGMVEVVSGLEPGALIVTAGQQKIRDGAMIEVVASNAATAKGS